MGYIVQIENLSLKTSTTLILDNISLQIGAGERIGLIGYSGSGKTILARAIIGVLSSSINANGHISIDGVDILENAKWLNHKRGSRIAYVGQYAYSSFSPVKRIKDHITDYCRQHNVLWEEKTYQNLMENLRLEPSYFRRYPHQLSGGQLQRINLLIAILLKPQLLILDEVTSAQDEESAAIIMKTIDQMASKNNTTLLVISHDFLPIEQLCSSVYRINHRKIERISAFSESAIYPRHQKIASSPNVLLSLKKVGFSYKNMVVLYDISMTVFQLDRVGIYGPSGSGKSTLGKILAGRLPISKGVIDNPQSKVIYIDQEVIDAFNPKHTMRFALMELARRNNFSSQTVFDNVTELGLSLDLLDRLPSQLSGGQLQRFMLVVSILTRPNLLILDETLSALDHENQWIVLHFISKLMQKYAWSVIIISHNEALLQSFCNRIFKIVDGKIYDM
jgi:ABC-type glutathione transport system ATPase component